jgi:hypothetical protein
VGTEAVSIPKFQTFDGLQRLHLNDKAVSGSLLGLLCPEDKPWTFKTVENNLPIDTVQHDYHLQQRRGGNLKIPQSTREV